MTLDLDGGLWNVIEFQHVKPGKGGAFVRTTLKNVTTGKTVDRTFNAGVKIEIGQRRQAGDDLPLPRGRGFRLHGHRVLRADPGAAETLSARPADYMLENTNATVALNEGVRAVRRAPGLGSSSPSATPSRACRETAPAAARSRPPWRPVPTCRCPCSSSTARRSRSTPATVATSGAPTEQRRSAKRRPGSLSARYQGAQACARRACTRPT